MLMLYLEAPHDVLRWRMTDGVRRGAEEKRSWKEGRYDRALKSLVCGEMRQGEHLEEGKITADCSGDITRLEISGMRSGIVSTIPFCRVPSLSIGFSHSVC